MEQKAHNDNGINRYVHYCIGTVPQFVLVQRIIELVVQIIVYFKWVKQASRFHQTLKMLAFDYQINRKRGDVCRRAILLLKNSRLLCS